MDLKRLTRDDVVDCQKHGYFDEHLATLYTTAYGEPYLYRDNYLLYHDRPSTTVWLSLFGLRNTHDTIAKAIECFEASVSAFHPAEVVTTSPLHLPSDLNDFHCEKVYEDRDYQIDLKKFNQHLNGGSYKDLRYRVKNAERRGYLFAVGKELTVAHSRIMALHMTKKSYAHWDYQIYLRLGEYLKGFSSPRLFNVFLGNALIGFDVVDFLDGTLAVPLGFYLDYASLADFLLYQEILHGKRQGFQWVDVGWGCSSPGLEAFKKKWKAVARFDVCMQIYRRLDKNERTL